MDPEDAAEIDNIKQPRSQTVRDMSRVKLQALMAFLLKHYVNASRMHIPPCSIDDLALRLDLGVSTLYRYIAKLRANPSYNPRDRFDRVGRVMSDQLEEQLAIEIDRTYITPGYYFNNHVLKVLAKAMWDNANEDDQIRDVFKASDRWCRNFRRRHAYVWRKAKLVRTTKMTSDAKKKYDEFVNDINHIHADLTQSSQLDFLVNMDETSWRLSYSADMTWAKKGSPPPRINVDYNTKECFTSVAAITANGKKLPLYVLGTGTTPRCEKSLVTKETDLEYKTDHAERGWMTEDVMKRYLLWLRNQMNTKHNAEGKTIHLILDVYAAHRTDAVKERAAGLNIKLYYVPAGRTDSLQPLDIKVFGALKAKARGYWYKHYSLNPRMKHTKRSAVKTLVTCWEELTERHISDAWEQYCVLTARETVDDGFIPDHNHQPLDQMRQKLINSVNQMRESDPETLKNILTCESRPPGCSTLSDDDPSIVDEEEDADDEEEDEPEDENGDIHEMITDDELDRNEDEEEDIPCSIGPWVRDIMDREIAATEELFEPRPRRFRHSSSLSEDNGFRRAPGASSDESPQNISIHTVHVSDLPYEMVRTDESIECRRTMIREDAVHSRKQGVPAHLETVGISNISASSAFNSFMQLMNLIPAEMHFIRQSEPGTFALCDFTSIFISHMQTCIKTINMSTYIVNLCKTTPFNSTQLLDELSGEGCSVMKFIKEVINHKQLTFLQNNQSRWFIDVPSKRTFEAALQGIDPGSIPPYVFASIKDSYCNTPLPWQIKLANSRCITFLVLKGYVTETNGQCVSYIRKKMKTNVLCVKDHEITELLRAPFQNASLALYSAYKHHISHND